MADLGGSVRRLAILVAIVALSSAQSATPLGAQEQNRCDNVRDTGTSNVTGREHLNVWDVNLKFFQRVQEGLHPDCFFDELARIAKLDDGTKPDLILGQEIGDDSYRRFVQLVENALGTEYSFRHTVVAGGKGGNIVVWRRARLRLQQPKSDVLRWKRFAPVNRECKVIPNWQIGVRLHDVEQDKDLVAASVHFGARDEICMHENILRSHSQLENKWGSPPLLVLGGDFNERPDNKEDAESTGSWRREENPDCWYALFSETHPDSKNGKTCKGTSLTGYFDVVREKNTGAEICPQWSHGQVKLPANPDSCDSQKARIDFIWVRYSEGGEIVTDVPDIGLAASDRGYSRDGDWAGSKYSDHRAVRARLTW